MSAFAHHLGYELKAGIRDKTNLLMNYLFPLGFFALVGAFMTRIDPSFAGRIVPAMAVFAVMCSYLLSMPAALVAARESGTLRSYRINGVPAWASIAAPALANLGHMALVSLLIGALSTAFLGAPAPHKLPLFAAAWLCMTGAIAGLGALVATLSPSGRAATLLAQSIYLPSIILGGLMTPPGILPAGLGRFALLFPASHAMRAFAAEGWAAAALPLGILALGGILAFALAAILFEWDGNNARPPAAKLLALLALAPYAAAAILG